MFDDLETHTVILKTRRYVQNSCVIKSKRYDSYWFTVLSMFRRESVISVRVQFKLKASTAAGIDQSNLLRRQAGTATASPWSGSRSGLSQYIKAISQNITI